jgi:ribonuclease III
VAKSLIKWLTGIGLPEPDAASLARFQQALTHRSADKLNYERLEFLGDALVNLFAAELLFVAQERASEGELTRARASIVDQTSLAAVAHELGVGEHLILGPGEMKSGGHRRDSILADAFEALVAATYLSYGKEIAQGWTTPLLQSRLQTVRVVAKDGKTELQEYLQAHGLPLPRYQLIASSGSDHEPMFEVECQVHGKRSASARGRGSSLKRAEQDAASQTLAALRPPKQSAVKQ